ncbi:protein shuttle craft isoform X2 [Cephus cinctus]|uniref:Protein shuttle craft isoform X2 n=1 Tax=Cephus cinctus TaxID=211228 RepID=A0AAJ7RNI8_CEPCN|nr:protein shuttle craft isoform X2 [Cephus cinctus]
MATWDGSYYEPDDPNYHPYSNHRDAGPGDQTWGYYAGNNFSRPRGNLYTSSGSSAFDQNRAVPFQQTSRTNVPPVQKNVAPLSVYQEQPIPSLLENVNQCFFENNRVQPQLPSFNYKSSNYGGWSKNDNTDSKYPGQVKNSYPNIAEYSNLHVTADEFIPNSAKSSYSEAPIASLNSAGNQTNTQCEATEMHHGNATATIEAGPSNVFFNKKNSNYRQRESQDQQHNQNGFHRNSYKNQNPKNYGKFQNDRYNNGRQYSDGNKYSSGWRDNERKRQNVDQSVSNTTSGTRDTFGTASMSKDEEKQHTNGKLNKNGTKGLPYNDSLSYQYKQDSSRQPGKLPKYNYNATSNEPSSSTHNSEQPQSWIKNGKKYFSDDRSERYRERRERYSDRYDSSQREKRNNYQDYDGHKNNYDVSSERSERNRDKERNKNSARENKDKDNESWRSKNETSSRSGTPKRSGNKKYDTDDDASQRERLTDQLNRGQLECLVCCDRIKQTDYVWSCSNCYHVLHLKCTKKWAKSSQSENGWRCPACQNVTSVIPEEYFCFCGKGNTPEWNRREVAHSCGDVCGRMRANTNCVHKCTLLCHPGPCPLCIAMVTKYCGCGRTSQTLKCSTATLLHCEATCGKLLNCEKHTCEKKCHHGSCEKCDKTIHQECFCGKHNREVTCDVDIPSTYTCENICEKLLDCGNHKCKALCHPGPCESCSLKPEAVTHCCCGQTPSTEQRKSCLDEIPTCEKICCKRLKCGQPSHPHTCKSKCHEGDCPECELITKVKCRCGNMDKEIPCKELTTKADDARCEKRCTKKRSCGRHKCNQMCCIDIEHICPLPCSKTLSCGRHKCEQTCHKGRCQPCWRSSFDELFCECGAAVLYPPIPCGTRRPACDRPCSRQHACSHEVLHNCHSEATCPPCTVLTQNWCYGKHELRKAVPCHVNEISCGLPCNKPLSCGRHKCITLCHAGSCEKPGQVCTQPCTTPRDLCGHICASPCHEGKCPDTPCKEMVKVTCQCGHRSMTRACVENSRDFQRIASGILASKMADMQLGHSVDLEEVFGQGAKKQNQLKTLECNDECKVIERNRKLALCLQIVNPDLSGKLMPRYSDLMKHWAKKDPFFCQMVHDKLTELVQLAKTSKQKSRSYSFECMNRDKRHFVHEYCEQFGCESQAYDQEPKRNVVATAVKDKKCRSSPLAR